jgi:hypothetical protein
MAAWAVVCALFFHAFHALSEQPFPGSKDEVVCRATGVGAAADTLSSHRGHCAPGCAGCAHSPSAVLAIGVVPKAASPRLVIVARIEKSSRGRPPFARRGSGSSRGPPLFS